MDIRGVDRHAHEDVSSYSALESVVLASEVMLQSNGFGAAWYVEYNI